MRLTRVLVPSVRASPAAGKAAERLGFSPALRASFALRMKPMHLPPEQLSPVVVALPAMAACWQPLAGAQRSAVQGFPSSQLIGLWVQPLAGAQPSVVQMFASSQLIALPTHWPARQASAVVQALASLHGVPLATG